MKFSSFLAEQSLSDVRIAFEGALQYAKDTQKGELTTRDAINFLAGRVKEADPELAKLLDAILKNTK